MNINTNKLAYDILVKLWSEHGNQISSKSQITIQNEIDKALKNMESSAVIIDSLPDRFEELPYNCTPIEEFLHYHEPPEYESDPFDFRGSLLKAINHKRQ